MKSKKALSAASYPSRIFKNDVTIKCPDCMVLCSGGCLMVAANSKNKETTTSLFFSRRQRSKVIARVTRKSLRTFSDNLRAYLALAGGCDHALGSLRILLPMVAKSPGCRRGLHCISRWSFPLRFAQMLKGYDSFP